LYLLFAHPLKTLRKPKRGRDSTARNKEKVTCTVFPTHPFKDTHSKGKRGTHHRGAHRHTRQQACAPPAEGQENNPGSVCPNVGRNVLFTAPSTPLPQRGVGKIVVWYTHSADTSLSWDHFEAVLTPVWVNQLNWHKTAYKRMGTRAAPLP
jgi:hypothetical protein